MTHSASIQPFDLSKAQPPKEVVLVESIEELVAALSRVNHFGNKAGSKPQLFFMLDENTEQHCWPLLEPLISNFGSTAIHCKVVPAGEGSKSWASAGELLSAMLEARLTKSDLFINLGGGMISDLGGFAAGLYKRGMRYVNLPTTVLAMADASFGAKTAVNHAGVKNSVGHFTPARKSILFPGFLKTLPLRERRSGLVEMVKHGLLASKKHFEETLSFFEYGLPTDYALRNTVAIKAYFVEADPLDNGIRQALNLGHTVGHAIEALSNEGPENQALLHGEAVACGLLLELYLSEQLLNLSSKIRETCQAIFKEHDLLKPFDSSNLDTLVDKMLQDKKASNVKEINCTLLADFAQPVIGHIITKEQMRDALQVVLTDL